MSQSDEKKQNDNEASNINRKWTFYRKQCGDNLQFINGKTIKKTAEDKQWSTCLLNTTPISSSMCTQFIVEYTWISGWWIHPGFITSAIHKSVTNWNAHLGRKPHNSLHSVGFLLDLSGKDWSVYSKKQFGQASAYKAKDNFRNGDRFAFLFDFQSSQCIIYHNDTKAETLTLETKSVIPGLALYWKSTQVAITKWELINANWKYTKMIKWGNNDVLAWINNMKNEFDKILKEVKQSQCTGKDIMSLQSVQNIGESFDISDNRELCKYILAKIENFKVAEIISGAENKLFNINIFSQGKHVVLNEKVSKTVTVQYIKVLYKIQSKVNANVDHIEFYGKNKLLPKDKRLEQVDITSDQHLITVKFATDAGNADK